jgi:hypothetical protein
VSMLTPWPFNTSHRQRGMRGLAIEWPILGKPSGSGSVLSAYKRRTAGQLVNR